MKLTPELLLAAYAQGIFPMADDKHSDTVGWYAPPMRGILPLDAFHIPRSLQKTWRKRPFTLRIDTAFRQVIASCAEREETWINPSIIDAYTALHARGHAHSVECWRDGRLVGGLYGVSLGCAFFGESMFSHEPNASKIALIHLVMRLKHAGYRLLDAQYTNQHLQQFGIIEIPNSEYLLILQRAINERPACGINAGDENH